MTSIRKNQNQLRSNFGRARRGGRPNLGAGLRRALGRAAASRAKGLGGKAGAALKDNFSAGNGNIFKQARSFTSMLAGKGGGRMLGNSKMQSMLGPFNPSGLLSKARAFGQNIASKDLSWKGGASWGKGQGVGFVQKGIDGAFSGNPAQFGLVKPENMKSKEWTVSDKTKGRIDAFGKGMSKFGQGVQKLDGALQKLGINTTFYDKTNSKTNSKTLAGDVNGPNYVGAYTHTESGVKAGLGGVTAYGHAEAGIEARAGVSGKTTGKYGSAEGYANVSAHAKASASGSATLGPNGLTAEGNLYAGVAVEAEAYGRLESKPFATIGGVPMTVSAEGKASVKAGAYAYANGKAQATWNPPTLAVSGKAGAFAGARAKAEAKVGVGPLKGKVGVEGWAGVGFEAKADIGYNDGKLKVDFGIGAALGIGGKINFGFEIDTKAIGKAVTGVVKDVGKGISKAAKSVAKGVSNAAKSVAKGVKKAASAVKNFFKKIF